MSIKNLLSVAALAALCAACSDYDPGLSGEVLDYTEAEIALLNDYAQNFADRYGTADPDHTWGFGSEESAAELKTRAVYVNHNQWYVREEVVDYDEDNNATRRVIWHVNTNYLPMDVAIPGFPSAVDGKYYTEEQTFNSLDELQNSSYTEVTPIGDVTEEEILYVSEWFRTHRYPTSDNFDATAFFVQEISHDLDRVIINSNKQSAVEAAYNEGAWDAEYDAPTENGYYDDANYKMDYLAIKAADAEWEHANNFNATEINNIQEVDPNSAEQDLSGRKIQYWTSNGGKAVDFSYHCSEDNTEHNQWVIHHLTFTVNGHSYDGYYLAFDYEMAKGDGSAVYPDGFYSNWILKLSKGEGTTTTNTESHEWYRIMCEDLGNTDDFDFNDLVYDVYFTGEEPNVTAEIYVRAAGGTLPIYLGVEDEAHEAHALLDHPIEDGSLGTPINAIVGGLSAAAAHITLSVTTKNADDIPIYVKKAAAEDARTTMALPKSAGNATPQKICIPGTSTRWCRERQQIEGAYPHFEEWVKQDNGAYGFNGATPWNTTDVNSSVLY